jgi:hypothetical protein
MKQPEYTYFLFSFLLTRSYYYCHDGDLCKSHPLNLTEFQIMPNNYTSSCTDKTPSKIPHLFSGE